MLPNTTMMMHHPSGVARGQASDIQNEAKELLRVRNYCNAVLSNATGQPVEKVGICTSFIANSTISRRGTAIQASTYIYCYRTCDSPSADAFEHVKVDVLSNRSTRKIKPVLR